MNRRVSKNILLILSVLFFAPALSQSYVLNGAATQNSCNCYTLTPDNVMGQSGSVWNKNKIDLNLPFDFWFNVFLGCNDAGADGMVFILQRFNTSVGRNGSGLGFDGVSPSIGIGLDTYQNIDQNVPENSLNDPAFDHISIQANGQVKHGNDLAGPVPISATSNNVEDCKWHKLRISWDPATKWLRSYFDDVLRVEAQVDLVQDIFKNDAQVYWGFSAATGGAYNLQQFCTALNPEFKTDVNNSTYCPNIPIPFTDNSVSFAPIAAYYWNFGDGTTSNQKTPPLHTYSAAGIYNIKMAITGFDGCTSDTLKKTVTIGSVPEAGFKIFDTCLKKAPRLSYDRSGFGVSDKWFINNNNIDSATELSKLSSGNYTLTRQVSSDLGCGIDEKTESFEIKAIPEISIQAKDGCVNEPVLFNGLQLDNKTSITQWHWTFDGSHTSSFQNPLYTFTLPGKYVQQLWAEAGNGCNSDTISSTINIAQPFAFAGKDTLVLKNIPFQLNGSGSGQINWSPTNGLTRNDIQNPTATLNDDTSYILTATTPEGCIAKDTVNITVYKGSAIYVPTGFTPDGNGLNDILLPKYVGIKTLYYFQLFNRWGQQIFSTSNTAKGWDGRCNGKEQPVGSYVWILKAEDFAGNMYQTKGVVTILRN